VPGSLRDAIATTEAGGTVDFQTGLSGTIMLTAGELDVFKNLTITGPGADIVTVSGDQVSRVFYTTATVTISGLTIANGHSALNGGGIYNVGALVLDGCTIRDNVVTGIPSNEGGGIFNADLLVVNNSKVLANAAPGFGGGISNHLAMSVSSSVLSGNSAAAGGGIRNTGTANVIDSTLSSNTATGEGGGGAIFDGSTDGVGTGTLTVTSSTIRNNVSKGGGGGIEGASGSWTDQVQATAVNSTIGGNMAAGDGGAIQMLNTGALTVISTTISRNSAAHGGGLQSNVALIGGVRNTIIAGNNADTGPDVDLNLHSLGHNLIGNSDGGSGFVPSDLLNVDPRLGPLRDNGGPTPTMNLLAGSPAIDAGSNTDAPVWDQRGPGYPRIVNGVIDIGAYEVQTTKIVKVTNTQSEGPGSLRQAILEANVTAEMIAIISFAIPGSGVETIHLNSPLPAITHPVVVDGTTQPGYAGQPVIVLDGTGLGDGVDGLTITAGDSMVKGLGIDDFSGAGIRLHDNGRDLIVGNYLGTDASGSRARSNQTGIRIDTGSGDRIGGVNATDRNLISGNSAAGVAIFSGTGHHVIGNFIGTDATGTKAIPNGDGVSVTANANTIGGTDPATDNVIAFNDGYGVRVSMGTENAVRQNAIFANTTGGIGLFAGGNHNEPAPELISVVSGAETTIGGIVTGDPDTALVLDFFANSVCDPSGFGQGQRYLGTAAVTTDGSGHGDFTATLEAQVEDNEFITATATDPKGNTSTFSNCQAVNTKTLVVSNSNDAGAGSLRQAILDANASTVAVTISFAIPGSGPQTIKPTSALPAITRPVIVDGTTQPGYAGQPLIVVDGATAGNGADGFTITAGDSTVKGLAIDDFKGAGIRLKDDGGDVIVANFLGVDATGSLARGNQQGIRIDAGTGDRIGGVNSVDRNLISGNGANGVLIFGGTGHQILGNFIGTDVTGTKSLGNDNGVQLAFGSSCFIGGPDPGAGNLISGNRVDGVAISTDGNTVQGNRTGTDVTGMVALGNGKDGVEIQGFVNGNNNTIGGTDSGAGDVIAFNAGYGVRVSSRTGNAIRQTAIFANAAGGIALLFGANHDEPAPQLTSATSGSGMTTVEGSVTGDPSTELALEFFANTVCDPSGFGQGERYLDTAAVTTDSGGQANFTVTLNQEVDPGQFITATATDPAGNTSTFSNCQEVTAGVAPSQGGTGRVSTVSSALVIVLPSSTSGFVARVKNAVQGHPDQTRLDNSFGGIANGDGTCAESRLLLPPRFPHGSDWEQIVGTDDACPADALSAPTFV
jgi:hypothetical protein